MEIQKYIDEKAKRIIPTVYMGHSNAVVFAEQHVQALADGLQLAHPEYDICTVISMPDTITFVTKRDGVDASELAMILGGGGSATVATAKVDCGMLGDIVHMII